MRLGDYKFKIHALEYTDVADAHGEAVAQALWEKKGHTGAYIGWCVAVPGWVETELGAVLGFEEHEYTAGLLKEILGKNNP